MMVGLIRKGDVYIVAARGAYDRKMAAEIEAKVFDLLHRGLTKIILDLKRVKGILSRGVHSLIEINDRIKELEGTMKLAGLRRDVKFVLEFAKLNEVFEIFPDQDSALKSFRMLPGGAKA